MNMLQRETNVKLTLRKNLEKTANLGKVLGSLIFNKVSRSIKVVTICTQNILRYFSIDTGATNYSLNHLHTFTCC